MKTENNLENKSKFFALYYGQLVLSHNSWIDKKAYKLLTPDNFEDWIIQLKPLESISDEDAIAFFDIVWAKVGTHKNKPLDFKIDFGKDWALAPTVERFGLIPSGLFHGVDWLRSKSYALPWMDLTVQDLIYYGWIKLVK